MTRSKPARRPPIPTYPEFLPAALALEQTPPSRSGRLIIWSIALFGALALTWACVGRLDIVAVAQGKIVPRGQSKIIQPFDRGTVAAIHVREGQQVSAGDILVSLDATSHEADQRRAAEQLRSARQSWLEELAFKRFLEAPDGAVRVTEWVADAAATVAAALDPDAAARHQQSLGARIAEYRARLQALRNELATRRAQQAQAEAMARKYRLLQPIVQERQTSIATLYERRLAARDQYLQVEQQRIELGQNLAAEAARVRELGGEVERAQALLEATRQQARHDNLTRLSQAEGDSRAAEQQLRKARLSERQQTLLAPIDGTVAGLAVHTIGGIVTPAQTLMTIVPRHEPLLIEAYLPNRDVGFVWSGQHAAIKVDAFNFTRYGTLPGILESVSEDSIQDAAGALVYPLRVRPLSERLRVDGRWVKLSAGMAVTVEIRTGSRRVIDYFLSPLARMRSDSLHER